MLKDLRNRVDFYLRSKLSWNIPLPDQAPIHENASKLQSEIAEFLDLFDWSGLQAHWRRIQNQRKLVAADVGARTFAMALPFDRLFADLEVAVELNGIEIDAYRRFTNLRTRLDYGIYYSKLIRDGHYHPQDFLLWEKPLDFIFLLNPFVTVEALQAWGLPLKYLRPQKLFDHAFDLLAAQGGTLLLSSPSSEEHTLGRRIAKRSGFMLGKTRVWHSDDSKIQKQPRYGCFCYAGRVFE